MEFLNSEDVCFLHLDPFYNGTPILWLWKAIYNTLNSQKSNTELPSCASYGMSKVNTLKIKWVITICQKTVLIILKKKKTRNREIRLSKKMELRTYLIYSLRCCNRECSSYVGWFLGVINIEDCTRSQYDLKIHVHKSAYRDDYPWTKSTFLILTLCMLYLLMKYK